MTGFVTVRAADLLRLQDALVADNCNEAYHVLRTMADPAMGVALSNDGNHWADWQRIAATAKQEDGATCDCHERMGNDFYFLPATVCLKGDAAACIDATRKVGKDAALALAYGKPKEQPDCFTEPDTPVVTQPKCHHHRMTLNCPECERTRYQLHVDNRPVKPVRDTWEEAAHDAVNEGLAAWRDERSIQFDMVQGGSIERLKQPAPYHKATGG